MLSNIFLIVSMLALGFVFLAAVSGLLKDGLKGFKDNSKWMGISFLVYIFAYVIFLVTQ